jgi:hypothetical protein
MRASIGFALPSPLSRTYSVLSLIGHTRRARNSASPSRKRGSPWVGIAPNIGVSVWNATLTNMPVALAASGPTTYPSSRSAVTK